MQQLGVCSIPTWTEDTGACHLFVQNYFIMMAAPAGLGTDNLVKVQCNDQGQMLPQALDQALVTAQEQGKVRFVSRPLACYNKSQHQTVSLRACLQPVTLRKGDLYCCLSLHPCLHCHCTAMFRNSQVFGHCISIKHSEHALLHIKLVF